MALDGLKTASYGIDGRWFRSLCSDGGAIRLCEQHDVCISGMIVHGRVELLAAAVPERIAERRVAAHPFAQLDDA